MGRRTPIQQLMGNPARAAIIWLSQLGKKKYTQFFEGTVKSKIAGDSDHMYVTFEYARTPIKLPVHYSTCNADAFEVGDKCLCFAPNCKLERTTVIGFTKNTKACVPIDSTIYGLTGMAGPPPVDLLTDFYGFVDKLDFPVHYNEPRTAVRTHIRVMRSNGFTLATVGASVFEIPAVHRYTFEKDLGDPAWRDEYAPEFIPRSPFNYRVSKMCLGATINFGLDCNGAASGTTPDDCDPQDPFALPLVTFMHAGHPHCRGVPNPTSEFTGNSHDPIFLPAGSSVPLTGSTESVGDLGESLSVFYLSRATYGIIGPATPGIGNNFNSRPSRREHTGGRWFGNCVSKGETDADTTVTMEGTQLAGRTSGVLVYWPATGDVDEIWTPAAHTTTVKTLEVVYGTPYNYAPIVADYHPETGADIAHTASFMELNMCGEYVTNPSGPTPPVICSNDPTFPPVYALPEIIDFFMRYVHSSELKQELISGVPSPVVPLSTAAESYVLIPALYHESQHDNVPSLTPGYTAGGSTWEDISVEIPLLGWFTPNTTKSYQGETVCKQRLYSVRVEDHTSTLVYDTDILVGTYDPGNSPRPVNNPQGEKLFEWVESTSQYWVSNYVRYFWENYILQAPQPGGAVLHGQRVSFYFPLGNWWSSFNRLSGYTSLTADAGAAEANPKSLPFVCPLASQVPAALPNIGMPNAMEPLHHINVEPSGPSTQNRLNGCMNLPSGNWQVMKPDERGSVAAWVFRWVGEYSAEPVNSDEYVVQHSLAQYPHEQVRNPIAHGDSFWIYSAKTGKVIDKVITGVLTEPGSYLRHPCITPDWLRVAFVAHGFFKIAGFGTRFYAGFYLLDRSGETPTLKLISPVELRYPMRSVIAVRFDTLPAFQLATGDEISINSPAGGSIASPTILESRIAYHVACRRKTFAHSRGLSILSESGVLLDLRDMTNLKLQKLPIANTQGILQQTAEKQTVDLLWRGFWSPDFWGAPPPSVDSFSPLEGTNLGGTVLTIDGTGFLGNVAVTIGGVPCTDVVVTGGGTHIVCKTGDTDLTGEQGLSVLSSENGGSAAQALYTYNPPPIIDSVAPASGPAAGGTAITIDGENFGPPVAVLIGGVPATGVGVNPAHTQITCTTPAGTVGARNVEVVSSANGSTTLIGGFVYV